MAKTDRYGNLLSGRDTTQDLPLSKRIMPSVSIGHTGSSGMKGPSSSMWPARKKSTSMGSGMALAKSNKYDDIVYSRRERLAGKDRIPYYNNLLTIDRVQQVFSYSIGSDGEEDAESSYDSEYEIDPWMNDANRGYQYENQQLTLEVKPIEVIENEHRTMIRKYQRAIEYMAAQALLWHDLMEDLAEHPHLAEMFKQFQITRKLSGGTL